MSLTAELKEELAKVAVPRRDPLIAEIATLLRFVGSLHPNGTRVELKAEVDSELLAES